MTNDSFTDEQLLNLVNNTILQKTDFNIDKFTGGGVQVTSTYSNKVIKYKIYLTFGYDEKRNSVSHSEEIDEDIFYIWQRAILLKVKSIQVNNIGTSLSDLNKLMNVDSKIEDSKIEDRDSDRERKEIVPTSLRTPKDKKETLTVAIQTKLLNYPNINIDAFNEWIKYKKYKAINGVTKVLNFLSLYNQDVQQDIVDTSIMNNYAGLFEPKAQKRNKTNRNVDVAKEWINENDVMEVEEVKAIEC